MTGVLDETLGFIESLPPDLGREVINELCSGRRMADVAREAHRSSMEAATAGPATSIDGLGQLRARIPTESYHYWGRRLGYACWRDKQFLKEFLRDNPQCSPTYQPRKAAIIIP